VHKKQTLVAKARTHMQTKVLENVSKVLQTHDFVFGRVHFLADKLGWTSPLHSSPMDSPSEDSQLSRDAALGVLNEQLKSFHASLPSQTALIVYTACSDPRFVGALNRRKAVWDGKIRSSVVADQVVEDERWTAKDAEALDKACEAAKAGLAFFCVSLPAATIK
jgi:RNA exonuclease